MSSQEFGPPSDTPTTWIFRRQNIISLVGDITDQAAINLKMHLFDACAEGYPRIILFIHSAGGDAFAAYDMYDTIMTLPCEVDTVAEGQTKSAATVVFMAGQNRYVMPNVVFRPHQGRFGISPQRYDIIMDEMVNWKEDENKTRNLYQHRIAETLKERRTPMRDLTFMGEKCNNLSHCVNQIIIKEIDLTAAQAIEWGFAHDFWDRNKMKQVFQEASMLRRGGGNTPRDFRQNERTY